MTKEAVYLTIFLHEGLPCRTPFEKLTNCIVQGGKIQHFVQFSGVYFLRKQMLSFLDKYGAENRLTKSVQADLRNPDLLAGCKALGLIGHLITNPLWCIIDDREHSIIQMNEIYQKLLTFFEQAPMQIHEFMIGNFLPFQDKTRVHKGPIYDALIEESPCDGTTEALLGVIFPAFVKLCTHMFKDHLEGGIHAGLNPKDSRFAIVK
jgi:hypothetical protein